jgi:MFS transporter, PAT family, beta-lactamase induction signal transducer AmpG
LPRWSDRRLWVMLVFGFASGLPLALSGFTLRQWLSEGHVSLGAIGLTANIGLAYTLKFLWSPLMDQVRPPGPLARFGRRRGWLLAVQPPLALCVAAMAASDAGTAPLLTIAAATGVAVLSATQDICIDAWRIELFPARLQGAALAVYVWGYRVAMLVSGAGTIWFAGVVGWNASLATVAGLMAACMLATVAAPEPKAAILAHTGESLATRLRVAVMEPLGEFLGRPGAWAVLSYVALFYLGETLAEVMLAPFYRYLGFDRAAVAAATGVPSLLATMAGIAAGGALVARIGLARALIFTGFLQMLAMAMYLWMANAPGSHALLLATVVVEAFVKGLASAAFLAYLSTLCATAFTATQYALLTSIAALASHSTSGFSGFLAASLGWPAFFAVAMAAALPGMGVMLYILRRFPPESG